HGAYVGYVDPLSQKMDLATGQLTDYRPPPPSPKHEWNPTSKRWQRPVGLKRSAALARIAELETGQHRTVRETLIRACHAVDALKEALAPESIDVREAVDRMYAALSRLELFETELAQMRADLRAEPRGCLGSVDEQILHQILRAGRHGVAIKIGHSVLAEQRLIDEKIARHRTGIAGQNQPRGVGQDLGLAAFLRVQARNHLQRRRCDQGSGP